MPIRPLPICSERAMRGHGIAAPQRRMMNSRRLMLDLPCEPGRIAGYRTGSTCSAVEERLYNRLVVARAADVCRCLTSVQSRRYCDVHDQSGLLPDCSRPNPLLAAGLVLVAHDETAVDVTARLVKASARVNP